MPPRKAPKNNLEMVSNNSPKKNARRASRKASRKSFEVLPSEESQKSLQKPSRKRSQKSLEPSNEVAQENLQKPSRKKSQKSLEPSNEVAQESLQKLSRKKSHKSLKPSNEVAQESLPKPSRKKSQKSLEPSNEVAQESLQKPSRKKSQKSLEPSNEVAQGSLPKPSRKKSQKSLEPSNEAAQKTLESKTKAVVHRQSTFCIICKKNFTSKKKLNDHNTKHHFFRHCPNCPRTFQQTRKFILHLRSHLEDHPYECKICLESFNQKQDLLAHKTVHTNPRSLQCHMCSKIFPHTSSLQRHYLEHDGPPYTCDLCGAIFSNILDITVHSKNHVYRCVLCPKEVITFPSTIDLANHVCRAHQIGEYDPNESEAMDTFEPCISTGAVNLEEDDVSDSMDDLLSSDEDESDADVDYKYQKVAVEPVYNLKRKDKSICFICYDLYPSPELLKSHMKAHKWFPCNSCPEFFANFLALQQHRCDSVEVPSFRCQICNTEFECENCKNNCGKMRSETSEDNMNALQTIVPRSSELPSLPVNYCDVSERNLLYKFIERIKSQKGPLDIQTFNHIGSHNVSLHQILTNPGVKCLFPTEYMPYIEDLYSKFQDLSQTLCDRLNHH